ncbi:MAG: hypothetical protein J6X03_05550 [Bacilli bacterium]|nr:hypothetical protein [Bacilli bacterium]
MFRNSYTLRLWLSLLAVIIGATLVTVWIVQEREITGLVFSLLFSILGLISVIFFSIKFFRERKTNKVYDKNLKEGKIKEEEHKKDPVQENKIVALGGWFITSLIVSSLGVELICLPILEKTIFRQIYSWLTIIFVVASIILYFVYERAKNNYIKWQDARDFEKLTLKKEREVEQSRLDKIKKDEATIKWQREIIRNALEKHFMMHSESQIAYWEDIFDRYSNGNKDFFQVDYWEESDKSDEAFENYIYARIYAYSYRDLLKREVQDILISKGLKVDDYDRFFNRFLSIFILKVKYAPFNVDELYDFIDQHFEEINESLKFAFGVRFYLPTVVERDGFTKIDYRFWEKVYIRSDHYDNVPFKAKNRFLFAVNFINDREIFKNSFNRAMEEIKATNFFLSKKNPHDNDFDKERDIIKTTSTYVVDSAYRDQEIFVIGANEKGNLIY